MHSRHKLPATLLIDYFDTHICEVNVHVLARTILTHLIYHCHRNTC